MSTSCAPETITVPPDHPCGEPRYELRCKQHGVIATYTALTVRQLGARALQFKLDRAWLTHAASDLN